ncbi:glycosyltransferase family 39 protein [Noviherbaspirillum galbum]|uniref:Glycosyltransferase family 39 protein n=1 Tax=Noviherbaspirillum galbum TaxID=2709383 RepID=A0A6B3SNA7_9BURK|nr:glycosyltransferase family 39 protein [Noviherbaspirillum galbum]NEX59882.1 glycosyltransferase family 39 protein [Noviherbaspirillum galbum]
MKETQPSRSFMWGLFLVFCLVWFYALGARTLVPTDEGRYAEMAREMLATGDWITPRLNGIKYFEKPPLQTWMNALTFAAFGLGEWQARLWTGLSGLLGVVLAGYTAGRLYGRRTGFHAGMVLGSSFLWAALSHVNTLDMGLAGMMTLSLCSLLLAQRDAADPRERRRWMWACWAGMALAVLSKGLIGIVLPGAVLVLYTLFSRDWGIWKRLHLVSGLLVFFAITTPWFVLVSMRNPEFPQFFFIHEHFQRFTSKVHHREGPWYYFFPILLLGIVPWLGLLPQSLAGALRPAGVNGNTTAEPSRFRPGIMLLTWSAFIFFFFSISGSKLPSYILPIFPALAILIALEFERASPRALIFTAAVLAVAGAAGLAYAGRIPHLASNAYEQPLYTAYAPWVMAAAAIGLIGAVVAMGHVRRQRDWALVALAVSGFASGQALILGHEPLGRYKAGIEHVPVMARNLRPDTPLFAVQIYEQSIPFYLRRTFTLVGFADEMQFGVDQEPQLWIPERSAFVARWKALRAEDKLAMAIINPDAFAQLEQEGVPMRVIARDPRRVIVTNDIRQ